MLFDPKCYRIFLKRNFSSNYKPRYNDIKIREEKIKHTRVGW